MLFFEPQAFRSPKMLKTTASFSPDVTLSGVAIGKATQPATWLTGTLPVARIAPVGYPAASMALIQIVGFPPPASLDCKYRSTALSRPVLPTVKVWAR